MMREDKAYRQRPLFESDGIIITETTARFWNATYPIANIGSVTVETRRLPNRIAAVIFILGAVLALYGVADPQRRFAVIFLIAGAVAMLTGIVIGALRRKREAILVLKTSSGDVRALASRDMALVEDVKTAIEDAFDVRGQWR
jgi:hypothetical protein